MDVSLRHRPFPSPPMSLPSEFFANTGPVKSLEEAVAPETPFSAHKKAWQRVSGLLMEAEHIEHMVIQGVTSLKIHPGVFVLTNRRVIVAAPRWLGLKFGDMPWRLMADAHLSEGVFGSKLTIYGTHKVQFEMGHLPKEGARRAYAFAQSLEERVVEFRRQRILEERRAEARGVAVEGFHAPSRSSMPTPAPVPPPPEAEDPIKALESLKDLLDRGLISPEEFEAKRSEVLARI